MPPNNIFTLPSLLTSGPHFRTVAFQSQTHQFLEAKFGLARQPSSSELHPKHSTAQCVSDYSNARVRRVRATSSFEGKTVSITYSECVCVCVCVCILPLGIQHAIHMCHIVICGLLRSTQSYHMNSAIFGNGSLNTKCVLIFYTTFV